MRPIRAGISLGDRDPGDSPEAQLRNALKDVAAEWPSGVAVAAVRDGTAFEAITLTSFLVVSLEPPLVLISVNRHAAIVTLLDSARRWSVNLLGAEHARLASMVADRLPTIRNQFSSDEVPVLASARATLLCSTHEVHPAGDHWLYVGRVERADVGAQTSPLLYHRRGYTRLPDPT